MFGLCLGLREGHSGESGTTGAGGGCWSAWRGIIGRLGVTGCDWKREGGLRRGSTGAEGSRCSWERVRYREGALVLCIVLPALGTLPSMARVLPCTASKTSVRS